LCTEKSAKIFNQEVLILSKVRHPNIIQFLGACTQVLQKCIVMEFMPLCLATLLCNRGINSENIHKISKGIALAMHYLHNSNPIIIHHDLKPANILMDKLYNVKLIDFGASKMKSEDEDKTRYSTADYGAPEIKKARLCTEKVDLYSYGMVLYDMLLNKLPVVGFKREELKTENLLLKEIVEDCIQEDPLKRPTFEQIIIKLHIG